MKNKTYSKEWLVPIEREDMAIPLQTIIDASCPMSEKGRVVQLVVTMEYDEDA
jgi:hypothetical protein